MKKPKIYKEQSYTELESWPNLWKGPFESDLDVLIDIAGKFDVNSSNVKNNQLVNLLVKDIDGDSNLFPSLSKDQNIRHKITKLFSIFLHSGDMLNIKTMLKPPLVLLINFHNKDLKVFVEVYLEKILAPKTKLTKYDELTANNINNFLSHFLLMLKNFNFSSQFLDKIEPILKERISFEISKGNNEVAEGLQKFYQEYF